MSECADVRQMNNNLGNLRVEEGTFHQYTSSQNGGTNGESDKYIEIIEEPLSDGYRFRYENEGRNAGPIKGVNSKDGHTTHPIIKIHGHRGPACIIVSLITILGLYPHPHKLVGEDCKDGIFRKLIDVSDMPYCFTDLRIQCVKKKKEDVEESLKERKRRRINPFGKGFSHSSDLNKINFNAVRLCFQVLLPDSNGNFEHPVLLDPVISKPIYDSKSASNMSIMKLSNCSASVEGKKEIILLCGQVDKDDIEIIFYEEKDKEIIWTGYGEFLPHDVHYRVAISFRTPAYKTLNVHKQIDCFICLRRKSDGTIGRPRKFTLLPINEDPERIPSKRRKFHDSSTLKDFQSNNFCSPKPACKMPSRQCDRENDINLRVKKGDFEIRRNNEKVHCTPKTMQTTVRKVDMHNNVHCTPRAVQTTVRKKAMHNNVESTPRAMQNPLRKEITHENVDITSKSPIRESSLPPETLYDTGTVNNFNLTCNYGSTFNPLPSTSALGNENYVKKGPLVCYNPEKHASAMSQDQFVGTPSLGLPANSQQHVDLVYPADFENIQLNKAIAFGDPHENDKLKLLSKDIDPNQNYSNENASSKSLNSDDVFNGFDYAFDFLYGISVDGQMENILGVLPNSDAEDSTDDEQMSFQNNVGVLQDSDAEDSENDCLDRLSSLSLEPNSMDPDVTMRDSAKNSFSEAVGISILVSS